MFVTARIEVLLARAEALVTCLVRRGAASGITTPSAPRRRAVRKTARRLCGSPHRRAVDQRIAATLGRQPHRRNRYTVSPKVTAHSLCAACRHAVEFHACERTHPGTPSLRQSSILRCKRISCRSLRHGPPTGKARPRALSGLGDGVDAVEYSSLSI